jgi:hypothetical protein
MGITAPFGATRIALTPRMLIVRWLLFQRVIVTPEFLGMSDRYAGNDLQQNAAIEIGYFAFFARFLPPLRFHPFPLLPGSPLWEP